MGKSSPSRPVLRELGAALRELRHTAGLSQRALTNLVGISSCSRIAEAELGKRLLRVEEITGICDALDIDGVDREYLLGLTRSAEGVIVQITSGGTAGLQSVGRLIEYERISTRILDVAPLLVPGLLQTTGYAGVIMAGLPDAELRVALRAGRRDILTRRDPCELTAFIGSQALTDPIAGPQVMREQFAHLIDLGKLPNVTIRVVPAGPGYHVALAGAFKLIEFAKSPPVVLVENHRASVYLYDPDDVLEYIEASATISQHVAMSAVQSMEFIANLLEGSTHDGDWLEKVQPQRAG